MNITQRMDPCVPLRPGLCILPTLEAQGVEDPWVANARRRSTTAVVRTQRTNRPHIVGPYSRTNFSLRPPATFQAQGSGSAGASRAIPSQNLMEPPNTHPRSQKQISRIVFTPAPSKGDATMEMEQSGSDKRRSIG